MGADRGPEVAVRGAVQAARAGAVEVVLVGDGGAIEQVLRQCGLPTPQLEVVHAPSYVEMDEPPVKALRGKPQASVAVACRLLKAGRVDALVTAGSSGAALVASVRILGCLEQVHRPALVATLPTPSGPLALLDVGASVEVGAAELVQYAFLGEAFARLRFGQGRPRVGLLSNGEEASKGTGLLRTVDKCLRAGLPGYVGMVEGHHLFADRVDVVVCDGFVGNVLLKGIEGAVELCLGLVERQLGAEAPVAGGGAVRSARDVLGYASHGGALLIGLDGVVVVGHGRSDAVALESAIRVAGQVVEDGLIARLDTAVRDGMRLSGEVLSSVATPGRA